MPAFLEPEFMRRALLAALMVGIIAPSIGLYLVQRRLALMGDGVGHVALTGVALGFLTNTEPLYTALAVSAAGALLVELIRQFGGASADVALAMLFYGGIAGGVVLIGLTPTGSVSKLNEFLFGSILTVTTSDLAFIAVLGLVVLAFTLGLRRALFAVCQDEEFARVSGVPTRLLGLGIALVTAVTVVLSMRAVGVLLVSALMIVPVATAQQLTRSFRATCLLAVLLGAGVSVGGGIVSYEADLASGPTIVLCALAVFAVVLVGRGLVALVRRVRPTPVAFGLEH
jgi:zinc transport system permease protein